MYLFYCDLGRYFSLWHHVWKGWNKYIVQKYSPIHKPMKKIFKLIGPVMLLTILSVHGQPADKLGLWCSPDIAELTSALTDQYNSINPEIEIKILPLMEAGPESISPISEGIGMATKGFIDASPNRDSWKLAIARDIMVAIVNPENPYWNAIQEKGISPLALCDLLNQKNLNSWGDLLGTDSKIKVRLWSSDEPSVNNYLRDFTANETGNFYGMNILTTEDLLSEIEKDPYSVGFCRLSSVMDPETKAMNKHVRLLPFDQNENNRLDHFEDFYSGSPDFERGVWIGKYPKKLYSSIYVLAENQPQKTEEISFIEWLLSDGQEYISANGYTQLVESEVPGKLVSLYSEPETLLTMENDIVNTNILLPVLILCFSVFLLFYIVINIFSVSENEDNTGNPKHRPPFRENSIHIPGGLFFDKSHSWTYLEKDGFVRTGIDEFLQNVTGSLTKIHMKSAGEKVKKGEKYVTLIQQGKRLEIKSPVTGKILENNSKLINNSNLLNSSPYEEGWIYKIETYDWLKETKEFLMGENYKDWLKSEFLRLKEFLSSLTKMEKIYQVQGIMQDGGELKDGFLQDFGPEIWEEFQTGYLDAIK